LRHAITYDLLYNEVDDILIAGTLGRGSWSVSSMKNTLTVFDCPANLVIDASMPGGNGGANGKADGFIVQETNGYLELFLNDATFAARICKVSDLSTVTFTGSSDDDTFNIDLAALPTGGATVTGSGGTNALQFNGETLASLISVSASGTDLIVSQSLTGRDVDIAVSGISDLSIIGGPAGDTFYVEALTGVTGLDQLTIDGRADGVNKTSGVDTLVYLGSGLSCENQGNAGSGEITGTDFGGSLIYSLIDVFNATQTVSTGTCVGSDASSEYKNGLFYFLKDELVAIVM